MKQSRGTFKSCFYLPALRERLHVINLKLFYSNIFLHISENSHENTCAGSTIKIQAFLFRTTILYITRATATEFWHISTVELRCSFLNFRFEILVLTYMGFFVFFFQFYFLNLTLISKSLLRKFERITFTNSNNFLIL